jgi:hypothetical protein
MAATSGTDGTFVSDFYCDTANFNTFSPPIPVCKDAPQPPVQPGIKGDDYPYKDTVPDYDAGDRWGFYATECTSFVAHRINQPGVNFTNGMSGPKGAPTDSPIPVGQRRPLGRAREYHPPRVIRASDVTIFIHII